SAVSSRLSAASARTRGHWSAGPSSPRPTGSRARPGGDLREVRGRAHPVRSSTCTISAQRAGYRNVASRRPRIEGPSFLCFPCPSVAREPLCSVTDEQPRCEPEALRSRFLARQDHEPGAYVPETQKQLMREAIGTVLGEASLRPVTAYIEIRRSGAACAHVTLRFTIEPDTFEHQS